jgi:ribosomal protein S18 acetylase RimI-like enzyme
MRVLAACQTLPMLRVRQAESRDDEALVAVDLSTWSPDVTPAPPRDRQASFFNDTIRPAEILVAEDASGVIGYIGLHQPIPLPSHSHVLLIDGLAVDPGRQGQGIGRLLVDEAKAEARRRGVVKLSLRVLSTNASARRLYSSCGFTVEGVLRGEFLLDGQLVDDILMACRIDE